MAKKEKAAKGGKGSTAFDIMTVLGWVVGMGLIIFGITFIEAPKLKGREPTDTAYLEEVAKYEDTGPFKMSNIGGFINYPSIAITIGGTIAALMVSFPASAFGKMGKHMKIALMPTKYDTQTYIAQIVDFAKEARMKGLLSLEDKLQNTSDAFLRNSLMLVVDSVEPEKVHNLLDAELGHLDERHAQDRQFYDKGAAYAPGFGMIGTLIGLVNMLADMSDASTIGPAMATALLTTLYGSMLGNLFFGPISNKLKIRHEEEYLCKVLICEGVEAIQGGENPKFIEEKLQMLVIQSKKGKGKKGKGKKGQAAASDEEE